MATTTSGFRYPVSADDPDIPRDIRQLAEDIDNYLNATGAGAFNGVLPVIDINGNSTTATRLATARTISLGGSLSGSATFDGSANISISASVAASAGTVPTGAMMEFLGTTAQLPTGWLFADGAAVSRSTYSALFTLFGTRYGAGNGTSTFNMPNLLERFARGSTSTGSLSGTAGGSTTHQHVNTGLNTGSAGGHNHEVNVPSFTQSGDGGHAHVMDDHYHNASVNHFHTTVDHYHGTNSHDHSTNPPTTTSSSSGGHTHDSINAANNINAGVYATVADNTSAGSHTHTTSIGAVTSSASAPTTGGAADYTGAGTGNTTSSVSAGATSGHTFNVGNDSTVSSTTHSHAIDIAAFNTVGGEGAHTHGQGTSDSVSNIPPYIDVNYIVKT